MKHVHRVMFKSVIFFAFTVFLMFSFVSSVSATVMVGSVARSRDNQVYINYFFNHDYIEQYKYLWYAQTADGLSQVRKQLVNQGKIEDYPILISIPSPVFVIEPETTQVKLKQECSLSYGETGLPGEKIGTCYRIHYVSGDSYRNFLSLVTGLTGLFLTTLKTEPST